MKRLSLLALTVAACVDAPTSDLDLAKTDPEIVSAQQPNTASWENAPTLHEGAALFDHAEPNARRVHSLWIAGSNNNHVPLVIDAKAIGAGDVRIAVLGPLVNGTRALLGADGYAVEKREVSVSIDVSQPGEHLVVVSSHDLSTGTTYDLKASCSGPDGCGASRYDVIANPKDGALVGNSARTIDMVLGDMMVGHAGDIDIELWASPPMRPEAATHVATATTSGTNVTAIVPASVQAGDDLKLVVRQADRILDTGFSTRFAPTRTAFARLDKILYDDLGSLHVAGVVGTFEGVADLRLVSETREVELALTSTHTDRPGQEGNGWNAFDAAFYPAPGVSPHDGEILSVGYINGNGDYRKLGCFEYCNNLSGLSSCTGGERSCP